MRRKAWGGRCGHWETHSASGITVSITGWWDTKAASAVGTDLCGESVRRCAVQLGERAKEAGAVEERRAPVKVTWAMP